MKVEAKGERKSGCGTTAEGDRESKKQRQLVLHQSAKMSKDMTSATKPKGQVEKAPVQVFLSGKVRVYFP